MIINTPVSDFSGSVAGVNFNNGAAEVDEISDSARAYFARHGYKVSDKSEPKPEPKPEGDESGDPEPEPEASDEDSESEPKPEPKPQRRTRRN